MTTEEPTMAGKVCLVTGATGGIGKVTAEALARGGATVVVVGRSLARCQATVNGIRAQASPAGSSTSADYLVADLSSQAQIKGLANAFLEKYPRLDVLLNNAGGIFLNRSETADGLERTFALNHLAYFLLTNLLLDRLKVSAPARVVNVSSDAHQNVTLDFDDLQGRTHYNGTRAYSRSKLANLLFTFELARRLEGTGVTANALHPGFVDTGIFAGNGVLGWVVRRVASMIALSPEAGARTSIYLASSPEVEGISGQYFVKQRRVESSPASRDEAAARRLWQVSEELTRAAGVQTS